MNCCNDKKQGNSNEKANSGKGHLSHLWMMVLCCGAPMLIIFLLPFIGSVIPGLKGVLSAILPFMCPLMMGAMMIMMMRGKKGNKNESGCCEAKQIEDKQQG